MSQNPKPIPPLHFRRRKVGRGWALGIVCAAWAPFVMWMVSEATMPGTAHQDFLAMVAACLIPTCPIMTLLAFYIGGEDMRDRIYGPTQQRD